MHPFQQMMLMWSVLWEYWMREAIPVAFRERDKSKDEKEDI